MSEITIPDGATLALEHQGKSKILAVDDDAINLKVIQKLLKGEPYQLHLASSGEEALAIASAVRPDLILLDIMMPGIDGYETCRRIREEEFLRNTKILLVSANDRIEERLKGYEAGADDYITKPFDHNELLAKIRVFLRLKSVEEMDMLKSAFLQLINHETRTPLTIILSAAEFLKSPEEMAATERIQLGEMICSGGQALQQMFERVETICKFNTGDIALSLKAIELTELIKGTIDKFKGMAQEKHIKIQFDSPDSVVVPGDEHYLAFVFQALLENAIRFSFQENTVFLEVLRRIGMIDVQVRNYGKGIDPDFLPHIFDKFAVQSIQHHTEGLGLNLTLCREIIEHHGGFISVRSVPGDETCFTVRLPLRASCRQILPTGPQVSCCS